MKHYHFTKIISFAFFLLAIQSCNEDEEPVIDEVTYTVSIEGNSNASEDSSTGFKISLDKQNSSGVSISIPYSIEGTASSGSDFDALSGSASINNGESEVSIPILIQDDQEVEGDETIIIALSSELPENISLGTPSSITFTIADNDTDQGTCSNDNSISTENTGCDLSPTVSNSYEDDSFDSQGNRIITTNGVPNHDYANQLANQGVTLSTSTKTYYTPAQPTKANTTTSITNDQNRPNYRFGVAKNGVPMDPAPAEPFIFEDSQGEFNWDWVFEPTTNAEAVGLDCAYAHIQPDGTYHYHGNMVEYANTLLDGLGDGTASPTEAIQVGWAADGYPVYYMYAPTASGTGVEKLSSGYVLKEGERPGDGDSEPCGEYNGKYTNDYEWKESEGDLDACNGIDRTVLIGNYTYDYLYVITAEFPVIPRCLVGTPDSSFKLGM